MTPEQAAEATKAAVQELGGAFGESPRTLRRARLMGLSGWAFHVAGRGGALGDVRPDTVAAALGLIAPAAVREGWEAARRVTTPAGVAAQNLAECCRWGIENFSQFHMVGRLVELTERIVVAADAAGMPLFAAWRAMPVPDDTYAARAAVLLHLLREHRAAALLIAIRAAAMTPLEAIISGPEGEAGAMAYGWQPPYPPIGPLVRRRLWADAVTDRIVGEAYAALDDGERVELVALLDSALATLHGAPEVP
ncbi:MAG TPA: hypothetical protein VGJ63_08710 [Micromonosporaceae bacterium]|jgi:hypothetical protein